MFEYCFYNESTVRSNVKLMKQHFPKFADKMHNGTCVYVFACCSNTPIHTFMCMHFARYRHTQYIVTPKTHSPPFHVYTYIPVPMHHCHSFTVWIIMDSICIARISFYLVIWWTTVQGPTHGQVMVDPALTPEGLTAANKKQHKIMAK